MALKKIPLYMYACICVQVREIDTLTCNDLCYNNTNNPKKCSKIYIQTYGYHGVSSSRQLEDKLSVEDAAITFDKPHS